MICGIVRGIKKQCMRRIRILAATALLAAAQTAASLSPAFAADDAGRISVCKHYENRGKFMSRTTDVAFVAVLADACSGALSTLADPATPRARKAAAGRYLDRLQEARAAIVAIDGARMRAAPGPSVYGPRVRDMRASRRLVTLTGEFLILRHAGVFAALDAWVAEGADFALLAALR